MSRDVDTAAMLAASEGMPASSARPDAWELADELDAVRYRPVKDPRLRVRDCEGCGRPFMPMAPASICSFCAMAGPAQTNLEV